MKVRAFAKVNLTLDITGHNGKLHILDSVMASISLFDEVEIEKAGEIKVEFLNAAIPENNTALKAAELVKEKTGVPLSVRVKKGIPVAGGLGGSSADAAAVLYAAGKILGTDFSRDALKVGSDVPFMMMGGLARVRGTGEEITPLAPLNLGLTAINCGEVNTAACYAEFDALARPGVRSTEAFLGVLKSGGDIRTVMSNDLLAPAEKLNPVIARVRSELSKRGIKAFLSGSGGCLFVLSPLDGLIGLPEGVRCYEARTENAGVIVIDS